MRVPSRPRPEKLIRTTGIRMGADRECAAPDMLSVEITRSSESCHVRDMAHHTKHKHYWTQLRAALTAGSWGSSTPAKAFNGAHISWTELLRKFNKHCHGYPDVSETANQLQALSLLVAGGPTDSELDGDERYDEGSLALGTEGVLPGEHVDEAQIGFEVLKGLESEHSTSDVRLQLSSLLPLIFSTISVAETCSRLLCLCSRKSGSVPLLSSSSPRPCQCARTSEWYGFD
jgi:hypothetical protein